MLVAAACAHMGLSSFSGAVEQLQAAQQALGSAASTMPPAVQSLILAGMSGLPDALVSQLLRAQE